MCHAWHIFFSLVCLFSRRTTTVGIAIFDQAGLGCFFESKLKSSASRDIIRQF
jgi:hypothetical protein